jgi:hypothetical protein
MLSIWRKYPELADVLLPQKIMRPFWHPKANAVDDHAYASDLPYERPLFICSLILIGVLSGLGLAAYVVWVYLQSHGAITRLDNDLAIMLLVVVTVLVFAGFLLRIFIKAVPARHWKLERQKQQVTVPSHTLLPKYFTDSYDQFQAKLLHEINIFGRRRTRLVIEYLKTGQQICIFSTTDPTDVLVGYWSFIVQYMKPNAPLPDVPTLNHYPNTTPGVHQQITNKYTL